VSSLSVTPFLHLSSGNNNRICTFPVFLPWNEAVLSILVSGMIMIFFFFFGGTVGLNSGLRACKAGILPLESHL
jgi:hypothetical protein